MRAFLYLALICLLLGSDGCATYQTMQTANGGKFKNDKGEEVVPGKPAPGVYVLLPFAVAFDIVTSPFQLYVMWAFGHYGPG